MINEEANISEVSEVVKHKFSNMEVVCMPWDVLMEVVTPLERTSSKIRIQHFGMYDHCLPLQSGPKLNRSHHIPNKDNM